MRGKRSRVVVVGLMLVLVATLMGPAASAGGGKTAEFKFNNNYKNSVGKSPIKMTPSAGCVCFFDNVDVNGTIKPALVFGEGDGLNISRIPKANRNVYSIDMFLEMDDVSGYRRLLSFGPNTLDRGLYVYNGVPALYPKKDGIDAAANNTWFHVLITRNKKGVVKVYLDAVEQISYKDGKGIYTLKKGKTVLLQDESNENAAGTISNVRIYNRALIPN